MLNITWNIEKRQVAELKLYEKNPRSITDKEYAKLKKNLKKLGNFAVLTINTDNTILSGNQRKRALEELGVTEINCAIPDHELTETEIKSVVLAGNRGNGAFNWDMLEYDFGADLLKEIGFDDSELMFALKEDDAYDNLPTGDKSPLEQMTFTLSKKQADILRDALKKAKEFGNEWLDENQNKNGNALAYIASQFIGD